MLRSIGRQGQIFFSILVFCAISNDTQNVLIHREHENILACRQCQFVTKPSTNGDAIKSQSFILGPVMTAATDAAQVCRVGQVHTQNHTFMAEHTWKKSAVTINVA